MYESRSLLIPTIVMLFRLFVRTLRSCGVQIICYFKFGTYYFSNVADLNSYKKYKIFLTTILTKVIEKFYFLPATRNTIKNVQS